MEKRKMIRYLLIASFFVVSSFAFTSCKDDYEENDKQPGKDILAESIYDYLKGSKNGSFEYFLGLADEIEVPTDGPDKVYYSSVLKKTGSKTVFVANDAAFEAFFASDNDWGVKKFEDFSDAQRKMLFFSAMLDDAYSLDMLSSTPGSGNEPATLGEVMRKTVSLSILDTIPFEKGDALPTNQYWDRFKENGIHVLKDNSVSTIVYFLPPFLKSKSITNEDFKVITQKDRKDDEAFVYDIRITHADQFCKNGYVNEVESVLFPQDNLAEYIRKNPETQLFNSFLNRFCAPYYDPDQTLAYRDMDNSFTDSIFVKRYFVDKMSITTYQGLSLTTNGIAVDPEGNFVDLFLPYDPGKNNYTAGQKAMQTDMAAMFIPTDKALTEYFENGEGKILKSRYGTWDNVPDNVLLDLVNNHMKISFLSAIPSKFGDLQDKMGNPMGAKSEDIIYSKVCSNGIAYVVNEVYPPTEYIAVSAPVSMSEYTKIFNWAIKRLQFDLYLLSMEEGNTFTFFVPTDDVFNNYLDPVSEGRDMPERWEFYYNEEMASVNARTYDKETGEELETVTNATMIEDRLLDLLDNHIIVGEINESNKFYQTKGVSTLKVDVQDLANSKMKIQGGGNIETGDAAVVTTPYSMTNGNTYFIDKVLQPSLNTVARTLDPKINPQFEEFYYLCAGALAYEIDGKKYAGSVFSIDASYPGITELVSFLNTYHYTIYIPTNEAVEDAIKTKKIKTWDEIEAMNETPEKGIEAQKLYDLIRYHFQDNSVYYGNYVSQSYETASLDQTIQANEAPLNKFRKLRVLHDSAGFSLFSEKNTKEGHANASAQVVGTYNVMARDTKFNKALTQIETSSFAVIHQIDKVLDFNK